MLIGVEGPDFDGLVRRQTQFAFRVAWAVLRNPEDAEDVVQEMFLKLYRNGSWKRMDDERAFLARCAWRMAVDRLKLRRREISLPAAEPWVASQEETLLAGDWESAVHRMIDSLPEDLRQPLALSGIHGLNSRQIGEAMGISEGTVRTRIMRARELLKEKLCRISTKR